MGYWDIYNARLTVNGSTQRERNVNRLKQNINTKAPSNPSYKEIRLNGEDTYLVINTGTKPYYKEFESLPGQKILAGDYVEWANNVWLVYEADCDDEVYIDGALRQCQYKLYWQKTDGTIVSRFAWIQNASAYNNGEEGNKVITLKSNQFMVYMPYDEETMMLDNGVRIHMSKSNLKCRPYTLTRPDDTTFGYGEKGVLNVIFTQTECGESDKLVELDDGNKTWICDYHSPTSIPPISIPSDETTDLWQMKIDCSNYTIKPTGTSKSFTAHLYDENNQVITQDIIYEWSVTSNIQTHISYSTKENVLTISVSEECNDFGEEIIIKCMSKLTGQSDTIKLTVQEVF